jgi:hypothetical protein
MKWFGYIARLSEWGGGGILLTLYSNERLPAFAAPRGKGGGSQHPVVPLPSLPGFMHELVYDQVFLLFAELVLLQILTRVVQLNWKGILFPAFSVSVKFFLTNKSL